MDNFYIEFSEHVNKIKQANIPIIVEGKKDRAALESFGIQNIIELSKKPIFEIIEAISSKNKNCIILTDLDREGKELYGKLSRGLQHLGVKVDNSFRGFLYNNTSLRQIEGLATYVENNFQNGSVENVGSINGETKCKTHPG